MDNSEKPNGELNISTLVNNLIRSRHPEFALSCVIRNGKIISIPILCSTHIEANRDLSLIHFRNYHRKLNHHTPES